MLNIFKTILEKIGVTTAAPESKPAVAPESETEEVDELTDEEEGDETEEEEDTDEDEIEEDETSDEEEESEDEEEVEEVDVVELMDAKAKASREKGLDWRHSIVDLLKLLDMDSSLKSRQALAKELDYTGDIHDSAKMNIWLIKEVLTQVASNGGTVPEELTH